MSNEKDKKNTEISARVNSVITDKGITPNSFAKELGYSRAQTIYDIINGKVAPSYDFFNRFAVSEYSATYNLYWLLTGNGPMLRDGEPASEQIASTESPDAGREAIIYKGLLAEQRAEHKREIAARDEEIKKLNRQLGAAEAKLGEREARGFREDVSGGARSADYPSPTITQHFRK